MDKNNCDNVNITQNTSKHVNSQGPSKQIPVNMIVLGMAGSGKTTLVQYALNNLYNNNKNSHYTINLDPAVTSLPYTANIDIRDTVNYKMIMSEYKLGPNGAIMTSLNLFSTKFDQVVELLESKNSLKNVVVDTPGQIEVFTWSASGSIITESLASAAPTCILYVLDTTRTTRPATFMSNMLYACSIMYKMKLPFIMVFNKTDVVSSDYAINWMQDYESFQQAILREANFMGSLMNSMCLMLEEFYNRFMHVSVSAIEGDGIDELIELVNTKLKQEYYKDYYKDLQSRKAQFENNENIRREKEISKLVSDMKLEKEN